MYRGTTPTIKLEFDDNLAGYTMYYTMKGGGTTLTKTNDDMVVQYAPKIHKTIVYIPLTQDDTLRFRAGATIKCQMRAVKDDYAIAGPIETMCMKDVLLDAKIQDMDRED